MSEAEEEDAIGGTCECKEDIEILVGSEGTSHKNGNGSSALGDDNSYLPTLSDHIALLILARLPRSKYCDLRLVNRRFCSLIRSGTHLLVLGIIKGDINFWSDSDIWRYELELDRWFNGPMMITPRYYFAFADCGSVACVAGGDQQVSEEVLNSAEKYNPENKPWEPLPNMNKRRSVCSGFYMDSKFYVIGGRNQNGDLLICGECYDFEQNVWKLIPNMIEDDMVFGISESLDLMPDLMAVVNNELYYLEFPSCRLKVYLKNNNTWKKVGRVPSIELFDSRGVALKSLGNELYLIGTTPCNLPTVEIILCFCTPSPELDDVEWHVLDFNNRGRNPLIYNCCVMMV